MATIILGLLLLPVSAYSSEPVTIPPLHVGDSLVFVRTVQGASRRTESIVNVTVAAAEPSLGGQVFKRIEDSAYSVTTQWITSDWVVLKEETRWKSDVGLAKRNQTWLFEYSPGLQLLKSSLGQGETWELRSTYSLTITNSSGDARKYSGEAQYTRKVTSRESISVPAGDFDSVVIEEYQAQKLVFKSWLAVEADWNPISLRLGIPVRSESYSDGQLAVYDELIQCQSSSISFDNLELWNFRAGDVLQWLMATAVAIPGAFFLIVLASSRKKPSPRIQFLIKRAGIILSGCGLGLLLVSLTAEMWIGPLSNAPLIQAVLPLATLIFELLTQWAPSILTVGIVLYFLALRGFRLDNAYLILGRSLGGCRQLESQECSVEFAEIRYALVTVLGYEYHILICRTIDDCRSDSGRSRCKEGRANEPSQ